MTYSLDLYSENIYSPVEEKQNERRYIFAIVLAILIHIGLFIAVGMSNLLNHKRPEEIKIINVQIHSEDGAAAAPTTKSKQSKQKVQAPAKTKTSDAKQQTAAKQKPAVKETPKQQTVTEQKQAAAAAAETPPPQQTNPKAEPKAEQQAITEQPTAPTETKPQITAEKPTAPPQPDIFEQMTKAADQRAAAQKQQWADAHAKQETAETAEDIAAKETIGNVTAAKNSPDTADKNGETDNANAADTTETTDSNNIRWSSGSSRRLVASEEIEPPEEIAVMGIKTSVTIRFEVFDNGLIGKVEIINSAGDSEWDNDIAQQFKAKYKFEQGAGKASGVITIRIGY